ncbi:hypothetical protein IC582_023617 [Cucumis melo]
MGSPCLIPLFGLILPRVPILVVKVLTMLSKAGASLRLLSFSQIELGRFGLVSLEGSQGWGYAQLPSPQL